MQLGAWPGLVWSGLVDDGTKKSRYRVVGLIGALIGLMAVAVSIAVILMGIIVRLWHRVD